MPPERIVLHGNNKSSEELALAVQNGVTVVVDNWHDITLLQELAQGRTEPVALMLRFTPGIECHTHEYIRTGHLDSKFGFDPDQLEQVLTHLAGCRWAWCRGSMPISAHRFLKWNPTATWRLSWLMPWCWPGAWDMNPRSQCRRWSGDPLCGLR